ncbi:MAG: 3-hydroxyacyl-CoA dehydrogenase NAD-binding domain-containing protein [Acidobacteriota bacterium]
MGTYFKEELKESGILKVIFDIPDEKVNKFSTAVMRELKDLLESLMERTDVKGLYFMSGKKDVFIAGADLDELKEIKDVSDAYEKTRKGQEIFSLVEKLPFPTVAAIDGVALGGGAEFPLFFGFRVASDSPSTRIGFPEVNLGILPGWGGCQKLPELIGPINALDLMLTGRNLDAKRALRAGLVDAVFPHQNFEEFVEKFLEDVMRKGLKKSRGRKRNLITRLIESEPLVRILVFRKAKKDVFKRTKGNYPAPLEIVERVKKGRWTSLKKALDQDARSISKLITSEVSKNLVSLFFMSEEIKKDPGIERKDIKPAEIKRAGVMGAGTMGAGIAHAFSNIEVPVRIKDVNLSALSVGMERIASIYRESVKRKRMKEKDFIKKMGFVSPSVDFSGFSVADIVIEAVFEDMDVKKRLISEVEKYMKEDAIFASNTSSLSITEMQKASSRPENIVGMHFFNPVHRMPLVEIIRGEKTSEECVATVVALSKKMGKTPIVVKDSRGFLVNRILTPYLNEAAFLLEEGASIEQIDGEMKKFGMPMGPLRLIDEVGIDVASKVSEVIHQAFGDRMKPPSILDAIIKSGRLGKKSKKGFYRLNGKEAVDSEIYKILNIEKREFNSQEIVKRMVLLMINEASRCLEENIVKSPSVVDIGMIFGTGFPPFRGGLLKYADNLGIKNLFNELQRFYEKYGERFKASQIIKDMASRGMNFYQ